MIIMITNYHIQSLLTIGTNAQGDIDQFFTGDKAAQRQQRKGSMLARMADAIKDAFKGKYMPIFINNFILLFSNLFVHF